MKKKILFILAPGFFNKEWESKKFKNDYNESDNIDVTFIGDGIKGPIDPIDLTQNSKGNFDYLMVLAHGTNSDPHMIQVSEDPIRVSNGTYLVPTVDFLSNIVEKIQPKHTILTSCFGGKTLSTIDSNDRHKSALKDTTLTIMGTNDVCTLFQEARYSMLSLSKTEQPLIDQVCHLAHKAAIPMSHSKIEGNKLITASFTPIKSPENGGITPQLKLTPGQSDFSTAVQEAFGKSTNNDPLQYNNSYVRQLINRYNGLESLKDLQSLKDILAAQPRLLDLKDESGRRHLHLAIGIDAPTVVKILLEAGANQEASGIDQHTPLEYAISLYRLPCVKLLLANNCKVRPDVAVQMKQMLASNVSLEHRTTGIEIQNAINDSFGFKKIAHTVGQIAVSNKETARTSTNAVKKVKDSVFKQLMEHYDGDLDNLKSDLGLQSLDFISLNNNAAIKQLGTRVSEALQTRNSKTAFLQSFNIDYDAMRDAIEAPNNQCKPKAVVLGTETVTGIESTHTNHAERLATQRSTVQESQRTP